MKRVIYYPILRKCETGAAQEAPRWSKLGLYLANVIPKSLISKGDVSIEELININKKKNKIK